MWAAPSGRPNLQADNVWILARVWTSFGRSCVALGLTVTQHSSCPPQRTEKCLALSWGVGIAPAPLPGCGMLHVLLHFLCVLAAIMYVIPPSICTMFLNMYEQSFAQPVESVMQQCSRRGHPNRNKTFLLFEYLCDLCCASTDKKGCRQRAPIQKSA